LWRLRGVSQRGEIRSRLEGISIAIWDVPTALIGYSGAGKTTLLNLLAGFEQPDEGVIERSKESGAGMGEPAAGGAAGEVLGRRMPLYWVPQNGGLWPHMTVRQHLLAVQGGAGDQSAGLSVPAGFTERADEILSRLDLLHRTSAYPGELSAGERSRLSVGRGLLAGARVLLMDEPLAHVDPVRKPGYWEMIREQSASMGTTLIFSCHEPEILLRNAEWVLGLRDGRVWYSGTVGQLYSDPPEADLGRFAGPLNWFSAEQSIVLGQSGSWLDAEVAIRPEWLEVQVVVGEGTESGLEVVRTQAMGWFMETVVRASTGQMLTIVHGSGHGVLRPREKIRIRVNREIPVTGGTTVDGEWR